MAREGWISIRNAPLPNTSSLRNSHSYQQILRRFFKRNRVCPSCAGDGFTLEDELEMSKVETVKYEGIKALEKLKQREDINFGDVIRDIFFIEFAGKKPCSRCKGHRFVKRVKKES